jgi:hypothetical protein
LAHDTCSFLSSDDDDDELSSFAIAYCALYFALLVKKTAFFINKNE